jgi:hypothetical protein
MQKFDNLSRPLAHGKFSTVYDLDCAVLKAYKDCAYDLFLQACKEMAETHDSTFHLPTIFYHTHSCPEHLKQEPDKEGNSLVIVEYLYKLVDDDLYARQYDAEVEGYYEKDIYPWVGISEALDKTLYFLEEFYESNNMQDRCYRWDLHGNNIMQRLDGTLVITDPWCVSLDNHI